MNPGVKLPVFFTILALSVQVVSGQVKFNAASGIGADIRKVIDDYPSRFAHITGEIIVQNPQSTDYQCNFKVNGAEECTITKYNDDKKNVSSWQAVMLTTEAFEDARKKFRALFGQLNNLPVGGMQLKGDYEAPTEEKKFTSVLFTFADADEAYGRLKVELVLESELLNWKVKLLVYDREKGDTEGNDTIDQ